MRAAGVLLQQMSLQEQRLPFLGGGKCRATAAQQFGSGQLTKRTFRAKFQRFAQAFVAAELFIGSQS